jgi:hypothetical protein
MTRAVAAHRHFALVFLYGYCDDFVQHFFDAGHLWQHRTSCPRDDSVLDTTCKILHSRAQQYIERYRTRFAYIAISKTRFAGLPPSQL